MNEHETRRYTLYGRRKGRRLRSNKAQLMETLLPRLSIVASDTPLNPAALFPDKKETWLEVGFGGGEHLAAQSSQNPDVGFLGCEPFVNGVASLLDHIDCLHLQNIRLYADDARDLLDRLPSQSLSKIFVLFADPWPKKRHADRRFIGPTNLPKLARVMKTGAELRLASDDEVLKEWIREQMQSCPFFDGADGTEKGVYASRPPHWPRTRYEEKGLRLQRKPLYFSYMRNTTPVD